ncbi:uncharacterized protein LOC110458919 [Mizuhopecten yessoensis]|uniref:Protein quiver n=1 Tax=Mizuhopecten yessoensis TaxID=6573 RepID=A0A210Q5L8_MIZYE|nr:uncharacterized protein LOC110458919 [Mizuhopecten yessoensis]OWF44027.1 hypothetical protein KP79_PYT21162 [Mizuhopecten yessoensis]
MRILFTVFIISTFWRNISTTSTVCWECTSLDDEWCTEHFVGKDLSPYTAETVNCTGSCMKLVAMVDINKRFYVRTCDVTDGVPGTCQTGSHVLGIPRSTICVCPTDRCNKAPRQHNGPTDTLITLLFEIQIIIFWTNKT